MTKITKFTVMKLPAAWLIPLNLEEKRLPSWIVVNFENGFIEDLLKMRVKFYFPMTPVNITFVGILVKRMPELKGYDDSLRWA